MFYCAKKKINNRRCIERKNEVLGIVPIVIGGRFVSDMRTEEEEEVKNEITLLLIIDNNMAYGMSLKALLMIFLNFESHLTIDMSQSIVAVAGLIRNRETLIDGEIKR